MPIGYNGVMVARSAIALGAVLDEKGPEAAAIRKRIHRVSLSRYRNGKRTPDAHTIAILHRLTRGRVAAEGWSAEGEAA